MSGIAGIFYRDGRPVDRADVARMTDALAHRGPDGAGVWVDGPVGLGHRMLHTTPESLHERLPLTSRCCSYTITADARIDNRDELIPLLGLIDRPRELIGDAEVILAAYEKWGERCPEHLLGDFAFAIWDAHKRQLFCARDAIGVKPFYFYSDATLCIVTSDLPAIFALATVPRRPNVDALVDYLINHNDDSATTEFDGVNRLRPAHTLTISHHDCAIRQYWDVAPEHILKLRGPEEYQEAFLDIFEHAVRARMRSATDVGVALSGGLDSSSILCLIEDLRSRGALSKKARGYSMIFPGQPYDESHYIRSVQARWGTDIRLVEPRPPSPLWNLGDPSFGDKQPLGVPLGYMMLALFQVAAADGTRVLLGGVGGDDFMDAPSTLPFQMLASGHPLLAARYTATLARFHSIPLLRAVRYTLVEPVLVHTPRIVRRLYRWFRPQQTHVWLHPQHAKAAIERLRSEPWYLQGRRLSLSRRTTYSMVHSGSRIQPLEWWDRLATMAGCVEVRHPFCDRRVVEFACSIPDDQMAAEEPKGLMRAALGDRLPTLVRRRRDKADFATLINYRLAVADAEEMRKLFDDPCLEQLGIVNGASARNAYDVYRRRYGADLADKSGPDTVWELLSLEAWLRSSLDRTRARESSVEQVSQLA